MHDGRDSTRYRSHSTDGVGTMSRHQVFVIARSRATFHLDNTRNIHREAPDISPQLRREILELGPTSSVLARFILRR